MWDKNKKDQYIVYDRYIGIYLKTEMYRDLNSTQVIYKHRSVNHGWLQFVYEKADLKANHTTCELRLMIPLVMEEGG